MTDNTQQKKLEKPFINSVVTAMQLTYELEALYHYVGDELHLDNEDFEFIQKQYEEFMNKLKSFVKGNKLSNTVVSEIEKGVTSINKKELLKKYKKFSNLLTKEDYKDLRLHIHKLEDSLDSFSVEYYKLVEEKKIADDDKTIESLNYYKLIRSAVSLVGAFDFWDREMYIKNNHGFLR